MTKPKRPRDPNQLAKLVIDIATGKVEPNSQPIKAHTLSHGRPGGLKGGVARAAKLTGKERSAIAKKAAAARWKQRSPT
jgi:hypothetical protein